MIISKFKYLFSYIVVSISILSVAQNIDSLKHKVKLVADKSQIYNELSNLLKGSSAIEQKKYYADSTLWYSKKFKNNLQQSNALINFEDCYTN